MSLIELSNVMPGVVGPLYGATPSGGTSKIQTLTIGGSPTAGAASGFKIAFDGYTTGLILWSATNTTLINNIDAALEALPNVGTGGVTTAALSLTAGVGTIGITSGGNLAKLAHNTFTIASNALTGTSPTVAIAQTTAGVTATQRGMAVGALYEDQSNGDIYSNTGTPLAPVFTKQT